MEPWVRACSTAATTAWSVKTSPDEKLLPETYMAHSSPPSLLSAFFHQMEICRFVRVPEMSPKSTFSHVKRNTVHSLLRSSLNGGTGCSIKVWRRVTQRDRSPIVFRMREANVGEAGGKISGGDHNGSVSIPLWICLARLGIQANLETQKINRNGKGDHIGPMSILPAQKPNPSGGNKPTFNGGPHCFAIF